MRRVAGVTVIILFALLLVPVAHAQEISAINQPEEITKGEVMVVYVKFVNTLNETIIIKKVRIEILNENGDLVNSSDTEMFVPLGANSTAVVSGSIKVDVEPGDYKYNVLVYYKKGDETRSKTVISEAKLLVKNPSNPRVALALTTLIFGVTLGFLVRIGSRGLAR